MMKRWRVELMDNTLVEGHPPVVASAVLTTARSWAEARERVVGKLAGVRSCAHRDHVVCGVTWPSDPLSPQVRCTPVAR